MFLLASKVTQENLNNKLYNENQFCLNIVNTMSLCQSVCLSPFRNYYDPNIECLSNLCPYYILLRDKYYEHKIQLIFSLIGVSKQLKIRKIQLDFKISNIFLVIVKFPFQFQTSSNVLIFRVNFIWQIRIHFSKTSSGFAAINVS